MRDIGKETKVIDIQILVDEARLLSRKCSCGSVEFRRIIYPESSFSLLCTITPCPSCKTDLRDYHKRREECFIENGLAICMTCKKIVALI